MNNQSPPQSSESDHQFSFRGFAERFLSARNKPFGEAFEHYYQPMLVAKQGSALSKIAAEMLHEVYQADDESDCDSWNQSCLKDSRSLAAELYDLVQNKWESNINVYLRTIDRYLLGKTCIRAQEFLQSTKKSFIDQFGAVLLERGESIDLIDQIVRRTGEQTAEQLTRVMAGIDPMQVAFQLWGKYVSDSDLRWQEIELVLNKLTEQQLREVRLSFSRIPAILIARELNRLLTTKLTDQTTRWSEVIQQLVRYALSGRSAFDIQRILFEYQREFEVNLDASAVRTKILAAFRSFGIEDGAELLDGFDLKNHAQEIVYLLEDQDELLSPFREEESTDLVSGNYAISNLLSGKFLKYKLLQRDLRAWEKEHEVRSKLWSLIEFLSVQQYEDLFHELKDEYGLELDADLHEYLLQFEARRKAYRLRNALKKARSIRDILSELRGLSVMDMRDLRRAWHAMQGIELDQSLQEICEAFYPRGENARAVNDLVEMHLYGVFRLPLKIDLLLPWSSVELTNQLTQSRVGPSQKLIDRALEIEELLSQPKSDKELLDQLYQIIRELNPAEQVDLEIAFLQNSKSGQSLLKEIASKYSARIFCEVDALLAGIDLREAAKQVGQDFNNYLLLRGSEPEIVEIINEYCVQNLQLSLLEEIDHLSQSASDFECREMALSIYYAPAAAGFYREISVARGTLSASIFASLFALKQEAGYDHLQAFERAFDRHYGPLRMFLKELVTANRLDQQLYVRISYLLEDLEPDLIDTLESALEDNQMPLLREVFYNNRLDIITLEQGYDFLHQEKSLRRCIDSSKATLKERNRTILYLDRFYPEHVAAELKQVFSKSGRELELSLLEVLADPLDPETPNPRIPGDLFWVAEMFLQIRLAYRESFGCRILDECLERQVSPEALYPIIQRLYGEKCFEYVENITQLDADDLAAEDFAAALLELFKETSTRMLFGVFDLYDVIARHTGRQELRQRLEPLRQSMPAVDKMLSALQPRKDLTIQLDD